MSLARKRFAKALRVRMGVGNGPWTREDAILGDIFRSYAEVRARSSVPPNQILVTDTGAEFIRRMVNTTGRAGETANAALDYHRLRLGMPRRNP